MWLFVLGLNISAYCASKFGMIGLTESLAREVSNYNIRVMTICPGEVTTKMQEDVDVRYYELNKHKNVASPHGCRKNCGYDL